MKRRPASFRPAPLLALVAAPLVAACGPGDPSGTDLPVPSADIHVTVDTSGVPHISADNDRDAFYGAGYMMASDRLLQMDMTRRRALGRWAEVLGESKRVDDQLARLFNWRDTGRALAERTKTDNPEEWGLITAWVAGVNRRIDEVLSGKAPLPAAFGKDKLDYMPEKWAEEDPLVIAKMTGFGNDLSLEFELFITLAERLSPDALAAIELLRPAQSVFSVPPEDLPAGVGQGAPAPPAPPPPQGSASPEELAAALGWLSRLHDLRGAGSNSWAIDGRFTENGRPVIANDPHLGFSSPGMLYALHIDSTPGGGNFNVEGFSLPAVPGVSLGHTDRVAWTATTAFADVMDVWEAPLVDSETKILLAGESVPFVRRTEEIIVKGQKDPVVLELQDVPGQGVLLPRDITPLPIPATGDTLFLRWTGYEISGPSRLTGVDRARSIDEFDAAVDEQQNLNFNMVAADASGITYRVGVDVPVRDVAGGARPWHVMNATDPKTLWKGEKLAREKLPRGRAKDRGYIVTANNDPFGFTKDGRVDNDPYYYGGLFDPGFRASRITTEMDAMIKKGKVTAAEVMALQNDLHEVMAEDLLSMLEIAWFKVGTDPALSEFEGKPELAALVDLLTKTWDGRMSRDSAGAAAYFLFSHLVVEEAIADDMGALYHPAFDLGAIFMLKFGLLALRGDYPMGDKVLQDGVDLAVLRGLAKTAEFLTGKYGKVDPAIFKYGDLHTSVFADALGTGVDLGAYVSDGGECTVNVSPSTFYDKTMVGDEWRSSHGAVVRMVTTFAEDGTPELHYNFPLGNQEGVDGPHQQEHLQDWLDGKYRRMPYTKEEIAADAEKEIVISPE